MAVMFVGHGLVAFAAVASVAARRIGPERALVLGALAAAFATLPDVDILFALSGLAGAGGVDAAHEGFWAAAHEFHRASTHSLVAGAAVASAAAGWRRGRMAAVGGVLALTGLLGAALVADGPVAAAMLLPMAVGGLAVATLAGRLGFGAGAVLAAAAVGLFSHPFGDLLAGEPPALLYPLGYPLLTDRLVLHPDPTVHLLLAFFLELATIWAALVALVRLRGGTVRSLVRPRAALGVGYAGAVLLIPAPTVDLAFPFVFSVLAVGLVGASPGLLGARQGGLPDRRTAPTVLATALSAVTLAALAYSAAYLAV
jgi:hypothetical protein